MNFTGMISKINHIIVSDPSYDKNVWCRYENDHFNANNWTADIQLQDMDETIEGYYITGTDIGIMLHHPSVNARMEQDRIRFPSIYKLNKYTIGMDRACVSIGVNEKASEIANEKNSSEYGKFNQINRVEKAIAEQGFEVKRMNKDDIKRFLAIYFGASMQGELIPDVDGEDGFDEEKLKKAVL